MLVHGFRGLLVLFCLLAVPSPGVAQIRVPDLAEMSIEDLLNIQITSAARKEQPASGVAAAIYVITQSDIRLSGLTTLPELFRLVPGMQVARITSSDWAVSIRGFNNNVSNKMLVLVDGRTIYNRAYTGVVWSADEMMIDDIERIEVIRGPGGAVWGANAVNGVINIITKSSAATQGAFVRVGTGTFDGQSIAARYGGAIGGATYRVSSQLLDHAESFITPGTRAGDHWRSVSSSGRLDWTDHAEAYMLEGSYIAARIRTPQSIGGVVPADTDHASALGRWTHTYGAGASLKLQSFFSLNHRQAATDPLPDSEKIADVDILYSRRIDARHHVVVGGGYRYASDEVNAIYFYSVDPSSSSGTISNAFAQDEIGLTRSLRLVVGSKFEHDSSSGWNVQPTGRVIWALGSSGQHLWAAASRAVRTPAPFDVGFLARLPLPPAPDGTPLVAGFFGNPAYRNERLMDVEAGHRISLGSQASLEIAAFKGRYDALASLHPLTPIVEATPAPPHVLVPLQFSNGLDASTRGIEVNGRWKPFGQVNLAGSYSYLRIVSHLDPATGDLPAPQIADDFSPEHQWHLRASAPLGARGELSGLLTRVGRIDSLAIPAAIRADLRLEAALTRRLSVVAGGQNLLRSRHIEGASSPFIAATLIPRSGSISLVWKPRP